MNRLREALSEGARVQFWVLGIPAIVIGLANLLPRISA